MRSGGFTISLETAYGSVSFFTSVLHNVFLLYHVETFISVYKIDKTAFYLGEMVFLVWNCVNDPLFGWISDRRYLRPDKDHPHSDVVGRRVAALKRNGPLLALAFLSFWGSWAAPWLQFLLCMCLYDGFLTMVDLHHSALLADLAVSNERRTNLNSRCSLFAILGSLSVFASHLLWSKEDLTRFRVFCGLLTAVSFVGFLSACGLLKAAYAKQHGHHHENGVAIVTDIDKSFPDDPIEDVSQSAVWQYIRQLSRHKNFLWFAAMNVVQVFHCHFNSNFFPLFLETLLGEAISPAFASTLLGVSFIAPHINNLYFLSLCGRWGVYRVVRLLFVVKLLMAVFMLLLGPSSTLLLCLFIASNRVFTEGTCKLLSLVVSDLVDEDYVLHRRHQPVSALIFGTSALLSKPGQSFAPLLGSYMLAMQTGHDMFASGHQTGSVKASLKGLGAEQRADFRLGCFHLLVYVTLTCALIQLVAWQRFSLRGARLNWVKAARRGAQENCV